MKVGTDSVLLGSWLKADSPTCILDAGSGCGILTMMMAQRFQEAQVHGIERHSPSVNEAVFNAQRSPYHARISFSEADLFQYRAKQAFDLIISNPPFFINALPSPSASRKQARHFSSQEDLINWVLRLSSFLHPTGAIGLVLPFTAHLELREKLSLYGLFTAEELYVKSMVQNPSPKRVLSKWALESTSDPQVEQLVLYSSPQIRTEAYSKLCRDFYL